ncbi:hypothetical protein F5148DRAFT_1379287 [Russula earlei]|uniref:Uncharacterized protein n=1 Tax=Russula earlei TaxID=71964 RepID=A0ACC0TW68_9AGAM|nr:hypothetical protein F5148DRAFT_1379287 [Russula earlei]
MSRLETLRLGFQSPRSHPDPASRSPLPLTRSVLPRSHQTCVPRRSRVLGGLLAQIEIPVLNQLWIEFFMDLDFVVPQVHQLISHTESFKTFHAASVYISNHTVLFSIWSETNHSPDLSVAISCRDLDYQLSSLAQFCNSSLLLPTLTHLDIMIRLNSQPHWNDDMETIQWLELLGPFTAVKSLRLQIDDPVRRHFCQALEELAGERVTEVLPSLRTIIFSSLRGQEHGPESIEGFVAARKLAGHPVAVHR